MKILRISLSGSIAPLSSEPSGGQGPAPTPFNSGCQIFSKVPFYEIHFCLAKVKIFLKAPLAPIYVNLSARRKIAMFWPNIKKSFSLFKKMLKTSFLACFFPKKWLSRRKIVTKQCSFTILGELGISN